MSNARNLSKFKPSSSGLVETADIADDAITNAKVADDAIDTAQIADNAVNTARIADDAVTTAKVNPAQTDITSVGTLSSATVSGALSAKGGAVFNEDSADVDFRVESNGNANMLFVDGGNDSVGVGISNPASYNTYADELVVGGTDGNRGITIVGGDDDYSIINLNRYSNTSDTPNGAIEYNHNANQMYIKANATSGVQINSDGSVLKPNQPCFSKSHSGNSPTLIDTSGHVIVSMGGTEHFDLGNNVDSIGKFTAPVAGRYMFIMTHYVYAVNASDDSHMYTYFYLNGSANSLGINQAPLQWYRDGHTANAEKQVQHIGFASLSQGDYVQLGFWTSHANIFKHLGAYLSLSGFLVG